MRLICYLVSGVLLIGSPVNLAAQEPPSSPPPRTLIISESAIMAGLATPPPAQAQRSRDSVKNGAAAGAVIGGIAASIFAVALCNAFREPGNPPCWRDVLVIGALGAGVGAAAGAGVDALSSQRPSTAPRSRR
jgi:hypothetical protein